MYIEPRSATAMTLSAFCRPAAVRLVPSIGSTAISQSGPCPLPTCSPLKSIGASSFSPSPMTTTPAKSTVERNLRMASTAAPSAAFLSPRPMNGVARMAAASVARTNSIARLRSGFAKSCPCSGVEVAEDEVTRVPFAGVMDVLAEQSHDTIAPRHPVLNPSTRARRKSAALARLQS
ncbi:exported hypothetical protein [Pseudoclavibacter sp. 8L]|nr:exported hypothetical protein [Pseudoclavibacter sp. 8L]